MPRAGWLAVGAVGGALFVAGLPTPPLALVLMAAGMLGASLTVRAVGRAGARAMAWATVALAVVLLRGAVSGLLATDARSLPAAEPSPAAAQHEAVVVSLTTPSGGQQRAVLELLPPAAPDRIYSWLPRYPAVVPGDRVQVSGSLDEAPDEPGFGEFLARSGIRYTLRARELERADVGDSPLAVLEQLRRTGGELIARSLPEPQAGLAAAFLIGLRDLVARDVAADFRTSGLSHVVAISGWHIAVVAAALSGILHGLARRRRSLLLIVAIAGYSVLAGASPSVVRAALMAGAVLLARESGRRGAASAALGLTVVAMLLLEPRTVTDVGFQLSVAATAGLLCWASPLADALGRRIPRAIPRWLVEALAVSLAAQAATLPLVLLHFGRLSLVAPLANVLVAPLVVPVMAAAVLALLAGALVAVGVPALLLAPVTLLAALSVGLMIEVARLCAAFPLASVDLPPPLDLVSAALSAAMLMLLLRRKPTGRHVPPPSGLRVEGVVTAPRPNRRAAVFAVTTSLSLILALVLTSRPDGRLHLTVLDVGQGDAILIQGPRGGRMLVDTGPDPDRLLALLDARLPAWDRRLDVVAITHPHEDHVAGLALLLDRYRIGVVIEPGMIGPGPGDEAFRRRMADLGRQTRVTLAGERLALDGITLGVRWPLPGRVPLRAPDSGKSINNVSLVFDLTYGAHRFVLTGDVEEDVDAELLTAGLASDDRVDVLKVAHHGSGSATTDAFLAALSPRVAVISAGRGNPYGHPSPRTVARLEAAGAQVFRTDRDGSIGISSDGRTLAATATGGRPRPAVPAPELPPALGYCPIQTRAAGRPGPYNRRGVHPLPGRSRAPATGSPSRGVAAQALGGGGRRRCVPCRRRGAAGRSREPPARRGGRTPPRHRQGAARG